MRIKVDHSGTAHSEIGASSADRWLECPASVLFSRGMPNESSVYAKEGTAAHEICEICLKEGSEAADYEDAIVEVQGDEFTVDDEMVVGVQEYLDTVRGILRPGDELLVEVQFDLSSIYPGMFGTVDCCIYRPSTGQLWVIDFKYGKGKPVEVVDNKQMKYYGIGALLHDGGKKVSSVTLIVVQPRAPHSDGSVREWTTDTIDLLDYSADLENAARTALEDPHAPFKAGDHCKWCPSAGKCPTLRDQALSQAQMDFDSPADVPPENLAEILREADLVRDWIKAVFAYAQGSLERGHTVPGYKLVAKRGTRKWSATEENVKTFLEMYDIEEDEIYKKTLITPPQAEKLLDKVGKQQLQKLWVKESSGYTLAPEADKRAAVNVTMGSEFD